MSRKVILTFATAAAIAAASLGSGSAYARGFGGGGFGGGHVGGGGRFGGGFGGGHVGGGGRFSGGSHLAQRGGRTLIPIRNPGHPGGPGHPGFPGHPGQWAHWHHHHWVFRDGVWIDVDGGIDETPDVEPAVVAATGPCTCLTKTYTPDGLVVFADVCTKEAASAPVDGTTGNTTQAPAAGDQSSNAAPTPTADAKTANNAAEASTVEAKIANAMHSPTSSNYAGRTYSDYLAANQQAAPQSAQKN